MSAPIDSPTPSPSTPPAKPSSISLHPFNLPPSLSSHPLGSPLRSLFHLRPHTTFLNHGSYGSVPTPVTAYHHALLTRVETHPDLWFRLHSFPLVRASLAPFAEVMGVDVEDVVWVTNATTAVNAVLQSMDVGSGDVLVTLDLTYGACKLAMQRAAERTGATYVEVQVPLPTTADEVVKVMQRWLDEHSEAKVRLALFDVITSPTAMVLPYAALCQLCVDRGIPAMLDAAHALGQVEVKPLQSNAAFLTTNCHKWAFAPKGTALLWAHPSFSSMLHPVVTSHFSRDSLAQRFWMQGTRDDTPFIAAAAGLAFYEALGMDRVKAYNSQLADWAQDFLAQQLGVEKQPLYPAAMNAPFMRVLEAPLPLPAGTAHPTQSSTLTQYGNRVLERLLVEHDVVAAFFVYQHRLFLRLSAQAYNERADYEKLAKVLLQLRSEAVQ